MQESWRRDADKLTFIICQPLPTSDLLSLTDQIEAEAYDTAEQMIGDVNLFLSVSHTENDNDNEMISTLRSIPSESADLSTSPPNLISAANTEAAPSVSASPVIGELELMIPHPTSRRQGHGRSALLTFLTYILTHESEIVAEFLRSHSNPPHPPPPPPPSPPTPVHPTQVLLTAKISHSNTPSLALFESLGFTKRSEQPNYFGEFEFELGFASVGERAEGVRAMMQRCGVAGYREVGYGSGMSDGAGEWDGDEDGDCGEEGRDGHGLG